MHSLMQVSVKSAVFGRFCFAHAYRDRIVKRTARGTLILNTLYLHINASNRLRILGDAIATFVELSQVEYPLFNLFHCLDTFWLCSVTLRFCNDR